MTIMTPENMPDDNSFSNPASVSSGFLIAHSRNRWCYPSSEKMGNATPYANKKW